MAPLQCLNQLNFQPLPHQIVAAQKALDQMGGRALLADEVGLGKTIEAGLVIKELSLRKNPLKVLILTPANLTGQWASEMRNRFDMGCWVNKREYGWQWHPFVVASLDLAKRDPHASIISTIAYDIIVIDEAHRLKNPQSTNYRFVQGLNTQNLLLLTATPLQNKMQELYHLIELLRPGYFGPYAQFQAAFMRNPREPQQPAELQQVLSGIMIRHHRNECQIQLPPRHVHLLPLQLTEPERQLYNQVVNYLHNEYQERQKAHKSVLGLLTLLREVCSSSFAALGTIESMELHELIPLARSIRQNAKALVVTEFLRQNQEKVIIFTEYAQTMDYLAMHLQAQGIPVLVYHGGMGRWTRAMTQHQFAQPGYPVLIATESGGEGINLQFCNQVINYDLPWNPMRLEQRIGRIHRLGQTRDVHVYNLSTCGTIEAHMLDLLAEKIQMFTQTIGSIERLLYSQKTDQVLTKHALAYLLQQAKKQVTESSLPAPAFQPPIAAPPPLPLYLY
ncbi:DEAD/DEAH box helicase [Heliophilum fasciatum]|uniref:Helicase-like protein n=1 Tax=Heliophilum fasciatum TaxID=35700 RepID=A0A4R2RV30_9FIRM|nr:SNF2-related protein [Heliophilum fasciatum]MCW2277428.1 SNF2 family DNA or RNA helicase [Heliophilum fasciatum]TCP67264.1 helicase-like protein [Heliophilum fasciatum]